MPDQQTVEKPVPLNKPALLVGSGPLSVQVARRWVLDLLDDIGRPELSECAELGVSELVTNAVLHAGAPVKVRVRGTRAFPRVEVIDPSPRPPVLPGSEPERGGLEDLLVTFGRGLDIVARCAKAWGADISDDGKAMWLVPAEAPREDEGVAGVITGLPATAPRRPGQDGQIGTRILGVPVDSYLEFQRHYRELRREVRLLALAHETTYPLAKRLSDLFDSLEREMRDGVDNQQIQQALDSGQATIDLLVTTPRQIAANIGRFLELLDLADAFCREERLLSLARSPHQVQFQRWFFGEFVRQEAGAEPEPWPQDLAAPRPRRVAQG